MSEIITHSEMSEKDTFEVFSENMKKASSLAKELATAQPLNKKTWLSVSENLDGIRARASSMYVNRALTRQQVLKHTEKWAKDIGVRVQ